MRPHHTLRAATPLAVALAITLGTGAAAQEATPSPATGTAATATATATITLAETIAIDGTGATAAGGTVTITGPGTYVLSGELADGMIDVEAPGADVELVLAGASVANADGPAILIGAADEATVTLQAGTANRLADGGASEFDAALYSATSLTIRGEGELAVEGTVNEGISSTMDITVEGGTIRVAAVEDGLNANNDGVSAITIAGGSLVVETETGDAIDSNGTITVTGGTVIALGALDDMNGGLDADGALTIDGGTVIATGAMLSMPVDASAQPAIAVDFGGTQPAGTLVTVRDDDATLLTFAPSQDFQILLFSSDALADGVDYTVVTGGTAAGTATDGVYATPAADPGTTVATVTTESVGQMGGPGGRRPGA